ncbi:MAG: hypothetical protein ABJD97_03920 [Betaproteobacteria bacterium]
MTNLISIYCLLSWRSFWVTMLNRTDPATGPSEAFTDDKHGYVGPAFLVPDVGAAGARWPWKRGCRRLDSRAGAKGLSLGTQPGKTRQDGRSAVCPDLRGGSGGSVVGSASELKFDDDDCGAFRTG